MSPEPMAVCPIGQHTDAVTFIRTARAARWPARFGRGGELWEYHALAVHILRCERHEADLFALVNAA